MQKSLITEHSISLISEPSGQIVMASLLFWSFTDFCKFLFTFRDGLCTYNHHLFIVNFFRVRYRGNHKITKEAFLLNVWVCVPFKPKQPHPQAIFQNDILKITYTNSSKISTETCRATSSLSWDPHFFAWVHVQCGWGSGLKETNFGRLDIPDDMKKKETNFGEQTSTTTWKARCTEEDTVCFPGLETQSDTWERDRIGRS